MPLFPLLMELAAPVFDCSSWFFAPVGYDGVYYGPRRPLVAPSDWAVPTLLCCFTTIVSTANYSMGLIGVWWVWLASLVLMVSLVSWVRDG